MSGDRKVDGVAETTERRQQAGRATAMPKADGLHVSDAEAPSYEVLRPYGRSAGDADRFPVYKDLEEHLLTTHEHPDPVVAHVMATCAGYAYSDAETVAMIMARLGLEDNHCRTISMSVDGMLIDSTAHLVRSRSGRVAILAYRGTPPLNGIDWLLNLEVEPEQITYWYGEPCSAVHAGFYRNVRATRYEVLGALMRACRPGPVRVSPHDGSEADGGDRVVDGALDTLYITGHSLGGAMAALMGVMLRHEDKFRELTGRLKAIYTFGQPMVGTPQFAAAAERDDFLREKVIRYVYDKDPVPHLPPASSGRYQHFGKEYRSTVQRVSSSLFGLLDPGGGACRPRSGDPKYAPLPTTQMPGLLGLVLANLAFLGNKFTLTRSLPMVYSFEDHLPQHYISAVTPSDVPNEFGD